MNVNFRSPFAQRIETGAEKLGWEAVPLKYLFRRQKTLGTGDEQLLSIYRDHGVVPKDSRSDNFNKASEDLSKYQVVQRGDLVINKMKAWQGSIAVSELDGIISPAYFVYHPVNDLNPRYAHYLLRSGLYFQYYASISTGVRPNQWDLDPAQFDRTPVPVPLTRAQQQIADYLDHETAEIDAFIGDQEKLRALILMRSQTLMETTMKRSSSDTLQLRRLKPTRQSGTSVNAESRPALDSELGVLKTGAASKGYFDATENKAVTDDREIARLAAPVVGDRVLVNRANTPDLVGTAVYVSNDHPALYLSDKLWTVDFDASNEFIALALSTRTYREQVSQFVVGASSSMQNLSYADFLSIRVPVPSPERQNQIVVGLQSNIRATRTLSMEISAAIDLARERRAALITAAVTGQIDVTAKNKPAAEQLEDDIAQGIHRESA